MKHYTQHLPEAPSASHLAWRAKWILWAGPVLPLSLLLFAQWADLPVATGEADLPAPLTSVYGPDILCPALVFMLGSIALYDAIYLIATIVFRDPSNVSSREKAIHFTLWTIGPPVFFFVEWFYLFPHFGLKTDAALEAYKQGRDITRDMWAGFVALFAASAIADVLKRKEE